MSRKAKVPIMLPQGVEAKIEKDLVSIKGPKGQLTQKVEREHGVAIKLEGNELSVLNDSGQSGNFQGLYWSLIANMVIGVSQGFTRSLEMIGVGYRASLKGNVLDLLLGYSHPVELPIPAGIEVKIDKNTNIQLSGIDKQKLGQFAADIRAKRPPEPYKGKGVRYKDEYVRRKAGKAGKK